MNTVTGEVPDNSLQILGEDPSRVGRDMLVAARLQWFQERRLSQGQSAERLGMKRGEFLHEHRVSPVQMDVEDL